MTPQNAIWEWFKKVFPDEKYLSKEERTLRFLEESIELAQSLDLPKERAQALLDWVYSRPKGDTGQEVGGVCLTLSVLCSSQNLDVNDLGNAELDRVSRPEIIQQIKSKQRGKIVGF